MGKSTINSHFNSYFDITRGYQPEKIGHLGMIPLTKHHPNDVTGMWQ